MDELGRRKKSLSAKILTVSALGVLLSMGLCGVGSAAESFLHGDWLLAVGVYVFGTSVVGIVVGVLAAIVEGFDRPK